MRKIKIPQDMIAGTRHRGITFGELEVIEYVNSANVHVRFTATGYTCITRAECVRDGRVKDRLHPTVCGVGCVGEGNYSHINNPKIYDTWCSMLKRCYSKKRLAERPSYVGCTVCPEWHNLQVFGAWYDANHPSDGEVYQLDKDIKVAGNRIYSPDTCLFVTLAENAIAANAKSYVFLSPDNERISLYNLSEFCRKNRLNISGMSEVSLGNKPHHKGWTKA